MNKRVLMITTSHSSMGDTGKSTGVWMEELATPLYLLQDAGVSVDIASPKGGQVPFDPNSVKPEGENDAASERLLKDRALQEVLAHTKLASDVDVTAYDAIFIPGGHGTMWDLPLDADVTRIVESAWATGKIVAAVCHGPAGLVTAKQADGTSILAGKRVNGFTDTEEVGAGLAEVVPFSLEQRMRELGGKFESGPDWQAYAVRDGQLITGQNPASAGLVAQQVLKALGQ